MGFHDRVQESNKKDIQRMGYFARGVVGLVTLAAPLVVGYDVMQEDSIVRDTFSDAANYRNESRENYVANVPDQYKLSELDR